MNDWLLIGLGLAILVAGAELLVRGASVLASRLGVSPLVVGLTVVAFGTSSPELAVSLSAVARDQPDLVLGNAVGSNTFNVLFILGLSAVVRPLIVSQKLIRVDVPIMIAISIVLWALLLDGSLGRFDGVVLLAGIVTYTILAIQVSRRESLAVVEEYASAVPKPIRHSIMKALILIAVGLAGCVLGARWFVSGAVAVATDMGVSELVIGLTIVAAGTSLPEVATSLVAVVRGQRDIAVGNVIGSNIFNILGILGLAGVVAPRGIPVEPSLMAFDLPVMIAVAIACLPIAFTGFRINRWEGGMLFGAYLAYIAFIVLTSNQHELAGWLSTAMRYFVIPIAGFGILMSVGHVFIARGRH
ncbi:MAG: sodium:calcium antiporter [Phycisphaerae bacterium]|nr:MAG: sodium:calcium antiporter [Phycisphaerae bacterium]